MNKGTQSLSKLYYSAYANTVLNKNSHVHQNLITEYLLPLANSQHDRIWDKGGGADPPSLYRLAKGLKGQIIVQNKEGGGVPPYYWRNGTDGQSHL